MRKQSLRSKDPNPHRVIQEIISHGFPIERGRLIHGLVGGSQLHGVKLVGTDDHDIYGIYIEVPEDSFWRGFDHFVASTSPQSERNKASDVDVTCYSLRKFARLAAAGNPTILHMLFTESARGEVEWKAILKSRGLFLASGHSHKYKGYADAQMRRLVSKGSRGKHGQRPELEKKFGYDVKAAMHTLRLLHEGIELMNRGWVTLPRPEPERSKLLEVRRGEWTAERVIAEANRLFAQLDVAAERSSLPELVDLDAVGALVTKIYLQSWRKWGWSC